MTFDPKDWYAFKELVAHATGWPMDTLHVMVGVLLQLFFAAVLRRSIARPAPWLIVLALELANEVYDLWFERWPDLAMQLGEGLRDILGTMILPTVLLLVARRWPGLLAGRR
ncbi:hypothetical protein [Sphingomonas astaxanthinifaciens]|uniref:VanZ-like domain-containing protein n=1 Tax=Sphingomonas astaxanthinifaciens DSM 22298 TaxID=1123267 RepID=A0ABQ5Z625_9SPHN|nr:hypothetical protein [Sphingomonas astaxanthinifaciens]GLR46962.1 hypothetical protein GCM10007925_06730 [Sphingomonas astaxanthinifaciens DSM 22298]